MSKSGSEFIAAAVQVEGRQIWLKLASGEKVELPTSKFPRLAKASAEALKGVELRRGGAALRWAALDEDIKVETVVKGHWPTHGGRRLGAGRKPLYRTQITAYLDQVLFRKLGSVERAKKITKSEIIRTAVSEYLGRLSDPSSSETLLISRPPDAAGGIISSRPETLVSGIHRPRNLGAVHRRPAGKPVAALETK